MPLRQAKDLPNNFSIDEETGLENDMIGRLAQTLDVLTNLRMLPRMDRYTERSTGRQTRYETGYCWKQKRIVLRAMRF
jgi:hypothetical protein